MKKVQHYICDYCNTPYEKETSAIACEKGHKRAIRIMGEKYKSIYSNEAGYPIAIDVEMSNGAILRYSNYTCL